MFESATDDPSLLLFRRLFLFFFVGAADVDNDEVVDVVESMARGECIDAVDDGRLADAADVGVVDDDIIMASLDNNRISRR